METLGFMINVVVNVNQRVDVDFHVSDIVHAINEIPFPNRWNTIAAILTHIDLKDDNLTDEQRELIVTFLKKQLKLFK